MDELELLSLEHSRDRFEIIDGQRSADFGLILADAMIYAIGFISIIIAISDIAPTINPLNWAWSQGDLVLLGCGFGLWLCSQSLNDFKRLLPLWLRMVLKMGIGPKSFAEQSESAQKRRALTLIISSILSGSIGWRISILEQSIVTRIGIDFHYVIYAVALALLVLGMYWLKLIGKDNTILQFDR